MKPVLTSSNSMVISPKSGHCTLFRLLDMLNVILNLKLTP